MKLELPLLLLIASLSVFACGGITTQPDAPNAPISDAGPQDAHLCLEARIECMRGHR